VTAFNGAKYRKRPSQRVIEELKTMPSHFVAFLDDNLGGLSRRDAQDTKRLLNDIITEGIRIRWGSQTGINWADDDELLALTRKSGCLELFIGIESINESSLHGTAKKGNVVRSVSRVRKAIHRFHDHGIGVIGAFVFGNDEDDSDIFSKTRDFVHETELDGCNLTVSTPYPGTRLFGRIKRERRLLYGDFPEDWRHFNFANVTFRPAKMTVRELQDGYFRLVEELTQLPVSLKRAYKTFRMSHDMLTTAAFYYWNRGYWRNNRGFKRISEEAHQPGA